MTETKLQSAILDALRRCFGWAQWARNNTGRRGGVAFGLGKGSPDIIGCVNGCTCPHCGGLVPFGRFVGLEVKTPTGVVGADQTEWALRWSAAGAHVEVVRSVEDALGAVQRSQEATS